ncbi:MAG TPA: DUF1844 domain-containing protein [Candidatus Acidoferrales bacterium]|nr:DUF1844 domain-containing protein [Terriglobia bacterium]
MADRQQDEGFKVVDRRLFTDAGELRKDAVERERLEEEAASKAANIAQEKARSDSKKSQKPGVAGTSTGMLEVPGGGNSQPTSAETAAETIEPSRNFQMLVDFLTRNAAAMLGGMADPQTGKAYVDLEGAHEVIDMLDVLREKTRGNLAKADDDLLAEMIGSLKLTYMEISKAAAAQMAKQAAQKK